VHGYLNNNFQNKWIGRAAPKHGVSRSPQSIPLDFFPQDFIKSKVYKTKVPDIHDLWQCIYEAAQALTFTMLCDVFRAIVERWE
jgi:hypothetical protein